MSLRSSFCSRFGVSARKSLYSQRFCLDFGRDRGLKKTVMRKTVFFISYEMGILGKDVILSAILPKFRSAPDLVREGSLFRFSCHCHCYFFSLTPDLRPLTPDFFISMPCPIY